jgi:hypothetical protein
VTGPRGSACRSRGGTARPRRRRRRTRRPTGWWCHSRTGSTGGRPPRRPGSLRPPTGGSVETTSGAGVLNGPSAGVSPHLGTAACGYSSARGGHCCVWVQQRPSWALLRKSAAVPSRGPTMSWCGPAAMRCRSRLNRGRTLDPAPAARARAGQESSASSSGKAAPVVSEPAAGGGHRVDQRVQREGGQRGIGRPLSTASMTACPTASACCIIPSRSHWTGGSDTGRGRLNGARDHHHRAVPWMRAPPHPCGC